MIIIQCLRYCHTLLAYNDKEMFLALLRCNNA